MERDSTFFRIQTSTYKLDTTIHALNVQKNAKSVDYIVVTSPLFKVHFVLFLVHICKICTEMTNQEGHSYEDLHTTSLMYGDEGHSLINV